VTWKDLKTRFGEVGFIGRVVLCTGHDNQDVALVYYHQTCHVLNAIRMFNGYQWDDNILEVNQVIAGGFF